MTTNTHPYDGMTANEIAEAFDGMFSASRTEQELADCATCLDGTHPKMTGALVAYITASYENALARIRRDAAAQALAAETPSTETPTAPHTHRATVIDRAIAKNIRITDADVNASATLREVAIDFVSTYRGENGFVQDVAIRLADYGHLSPAQMRGALNVMVAEAKIARAKLAATVETEIAAATRALIAPAAPEAAYLDLRSNKDRAIEDAADASAATVAIDDQALALARRLPNGTYTVIINAATDEYRTLRLADAPDHFNTKPGTQIVSYLNGPNNEGDFVSFAFVTGDFVSVWKKYRANIDSKITLALKMLVTSADPMAHMREYVLRSSHCGVCGRKLSTPESIRAGIGPVCLAKLAEQGYTFELTPADRKANAAKAAILIDELFPE